MIGRIAGRLEYRAGDHVLIDVRGVGYLVYVSDRTMAGLPGVGEAAALYTDLLVREDVLQLFGFPTMIEKEWHRLLMTVQGVGAKAAMAIASALGVDGVARAIAMGDARAIQAAQGVGPKLAQRVILELKAKAPALMMVQAGPAAMADDVIEEPAKAASRSPSPAVPSRGAATADALSALANLGYAPVDAAGAVATAAAADPAADTGALIRAALKILAPK
jgi:holliday junction DNA helicase RuvA